MTRPVDGRWIALCYHDVQPVADVSGGGPARFSVPLASFELMLDTIAASGHRGCSLAEARQAPGTARVAITFDDATSGQFEHAMPALRSRGMTATVYAVTEWVGRPGFMTWDQLRQIRDWGMSVQSHSRSHPFLSELGAPALRRELEESKATLDRELRQSTTEIAFPGGDAPRRGLRALLWEAGYECAVGSRWGTNADGADRPAWVSRCTCRGALQPEQAARYLRRDASLAMRMHAREAPLRTLRRTLGPSRYARWRRAVLDAFGGTRHHAPSAEGGAP